MSSAEPEPAEPASKDAPRVDLRTLTLEETTALVVSLGEPKFRGEQIWRWVHGRGVRTLDELTNVSRDLRARLAERVTLGTLEVAEVQTSVDGTRKIRLVTRDGKSIESVLIPDGEKTTQCISSQVGCALDCQFCATAKLGLTRHLDAGEIVDQVYRAQALLAEVEPGRRITNLVYMGMGEPLHNYDNVVRSLRLLTHELGVNLSQRRITVSTVGLVPRIEKLGTEDVRPNLAVSLNAASDEVRDRIMPINRKFDIAKLLGAIRAYPLEHRRRVTFEYVLLAGVNDSLDDAARLARLLRGIKCKVNVIPWNPHPEAPYQRPSPEAIDAFQQRCKDLGLPTYLRTPRGDDIDAACGQLANRSNGEALVPLRARRKPAGDELPAAPILE
jgi:23S rRNA (adenine2503-C2)-methyltransferase